MLVREKSGDSERVNNTTLGTRLESIPYITQPYVLSSYCGIYIPDSSYQKNNLHASVSQGNNGFD